MSNGQDQRKERLAQALRDNLRRRKAQSRDQRDDSRSSPDQREASTDEGSRG